MRHSIHAITIIATLLVAVAPGFAQEAKQPSAADIDDAKRRYPRGRDLYEDNDLNGELVEIRRAYEMVPNYKLLFDIGQICYQLPDYPCALRSFKQYLEDGGDDVPAEQKADVEKDIGKLQGRVATLKITTNLPGAEILVKAIATDVLLALTAASAVTSIVLTVTAKPNAPPKAGKLEPIKVAVGPGGVWIHGQF